MSAWGPSTVGDVKAAELPRQVLILAEALARKHGEVVAARETSGLHLYMASPKALELDGDAELHKRHLAVNVEKYFRLGKWATMGRYNQERCATCMKYSVPYTVKTLLNYPTLAQRNIHATTTGVRVQSTTRKLFADGKGNMIPAHPGACTPINELPPEHVAVWYLKSRGYDLDTLWHQFRCSFCYEELKHPEVWYRRLPSGWRDTPQNRIVFFGDIHGVQQIWQARILEWIDEAQNIKYYLHPYTSEWVACEYKDPVTDKWTVLPELLDDDDDDDRKWDLSKYKTATGAARQDCVLGFDAAVAWNQRAGLKVPTGILVEGPLDAGRFGAPAMPMTGKFLSEGQALLLASSFRKIIHIADNDDAGLKSKASVRAGLGTKVELVMLDLPAQVKDPGLLHPDAAWAFVGPSLFVF